MLLVLKPYGKLIHLLKYFQGEPNDTSFVFVKVYVYVLTYKEHFHIHNFDLILMS